MQEQQAFTMGTDATTGGSTSLRFEENPLLSPQSTSLYKEMTKTGTAGLPDLVLVGSTETDSHKTGTDTNTIDVKGPTPCVNGVEPDHPGCVVPEIEEGLFGGKRTESDDDQKKYRKDTEDVSSRRTEYDDPKVRPIAVRKEDAKRTVVDQMGKREIGEMLSDDKRWETRKLAIPGEEPTEPINENEGRKITPGEIEQWKKSGEKLAEMIKNLRRFPR